MNFSLNLDSLSYNLASPARQAMSLRTQSDLRWATENLGMSLSHSLQKQTLIDSCELSHIKILSFFFKQDS